jgi:hypothetical protein
VQGAPPDSDEGLRSTDEPIREMLKHLVEISHDLLPARGVPAVSLCLAVTAQVREGDRPPLLREGGSELFIAAAVVTCVVNDSQDPLRFSSRSDLEHVKEDEPLRGVTQSGGDISLCIRFTELEVGRE